MTYYLELFQNILFRRVFIVVKPSNINNEFYHNNVNICLKSIDYFPSNVVWLSVYLLHRSLGETLKGIPCGGSQTLYIQKGVIKKVPDYLFKI